MPALVKQSELDRARAWLDASFVSAGVGAPAALPLSYRYGDRPASSVLGDWSVQGDGPSTDDGVTRQAVTFTDPRTALSCRIEIATYDEFPAVEWVVRFENAGAQDSPILSQIMPLDAFFPVERAAECRVHHARGGLTQTDDFEPHCTPLTFRQGGRRLALAARTGKSSTLHLPFFNLETGSGGVIGAIGWSGGWAASFERCAEGVRVAAGMERTHLTLRPGEGIRTPRILLLFWDADGDGEPGVSTGRVRGHNVLRRLILAHYTPRPNGRPLRPPFCEGAWGARTESVHLAKIAWLAEHRIPTECYWIDAGWYGPRPIAEAADGSSGGWMKQVGSWTPNAEAYPRGVRPIGDAAARAGLGLVLWVEPERAFQGSDMKREHSEWLIGPVRSGYVDGGNYLVNLGIPEARRHVTEMLSGLIADGGVTCYRQDFNDLRVPELCAMADAPDRIGMTEIGHITGLYEMWDELLARHPGLIIDNCAGGGQRIDLETISRSVPLWRSDLQCFPFDPMAMQTQSQGLAPWVPLSAAVAKDTTAYAMRSAAGPAIITHFSSRAVEGGEAVPADRLRERLTEAREIRGYFSGDFYALLTFSLAADAWAAWQYDRPERGDGLVLAFRRHESPFREWQATLRALDPAAIYEVRSWDGGGTWSARGEALMADGFAVRIDARPGSALYTYRTA